MVGRNIFTLPADDPGHAIMQYNNAHAFMVGNQVMIHEPYKPPAQFVYQNGHLAPVPLNTELERDALAHLVLPNTLYNERRYTLGK